MTSIANLAIDVTANIAGFQSDLGRVQREAEKAAKNMKRDFGRIGAQIGGGLAVGVTALAAGIKSAINDIDRLNDASKKLGVSTEFLSAMGYAAKQSGADVAVFERGYTKFLRTVSEASAGAGPAADLFKAIDVAVRDSNGAMRESDDIFRDVADRFKDYASGANKVELAQRLMGKAGAELIPLLDEGSEGLRALTDEAGRFGQVVSTESAEAAGQFNDDLDRLKAQVGGVVKSMAADLLPTLSAASTLMVEAGTKSEDAGDGFSVMEYGLQRLVIAGVIVKNTLEGILALLFATGNAVKEAGARVGEGVADLASVAQAGATGGWVSAFAEFRRVSADDAQNAQESWQSIKAGFASASDGITEAINDINTGIASIEAPAKHATGALKDTGAAGTRAVPPLGAAGNAAADAAKKVQKLVGAGDEMVATWREHNKEANEAFLVLKAQLDPLEALNQEYDAQLEVLEQARRANVGNAEALADIERQLKLVEDRYRDQRRAIEAQANPVQQLIEDLEFELKIMKLSNAEREEAIMLRGLEGKATEEQKRKLSELLQSRESTDAAQAHADEMRRIYEDMITDVGQSLINAFSKGGESIGDALKESLTSAIEQVANTALRDFAEQMGKIASGQGGSVGGAAGRLGLAAVASIGSSYVGGTSSMGESVLGGAAAGAAMGATYGSVIPIIGTVIGAVVGGIVGAIVGFVAHQNPILEVSSSARGINHGRVEGNAQSAFGNIFVGKDDLTLAGNMSSQDLADKIAEFDNAIASFLSSDEVIAAKDALRNFDFNQRGHGIGPGQVLEERFNAVVEAIKPEWFGFLDDISNLEQRVQAFQGLRVMGEQVEHLDEVIASLNPDSLDNLRFAVNNLNEAVATTRSQLDAAYDARDPVAITEANAQLEQAILRRYQAEVEMVRTLQDALQKANDSARQFGIDMATRLRDVGANVSVAGVIGGDLAAQQAAVGTANSTQAALVNLDRFVNSVDAWLSAARQEVEQWAAAARARIQNALTALDGEQSALMQMASERQAAAQAGAQAAAEAQNAANQAHIASLTEQLQLAQQWSGVLNAAKSALDQMQFSSANPLGGFARQDLLEARIADVRSRLGSASGGERSDLAAELITLLNQRLGAAGELFQRPSPEYLAVFNSTANELSGLREIAQAEQDRAAALQEEIASLQAQTVQAVGGVSDTLSYLSVEEAARLEAIEAERTALQAALIEVDERAAGRLKDIEIQARAYYEWAQTTGNALNAARHEEITAALNEITGGLDPDAFIAQRLQETSTLLQEIRDAIVEFLDDIESGGSASEPLHPPGSGNPRDPNNPYEPDEPITPIYGPKLTVENHFHGVTGDARAIAAAVDARMTATLPQLATRLKREMKAA